MSEFTLTPAPRFTVLEPRLARVSGTRQVKLLSARPLRVIEIGDEPPRLGVTVGGSVRIALPAAGGTWAVVVEHASLECYPREECPLAGWSDLARVYAPRMLAAPVPHLLAPPWRG